MADDFRIDFNSKQDEQEAMMHLTTSMWIEITTLKQFVMKLSQAAFQKSKTEMQEWHDQIAGQQEIELSIALSVFGEVHLPERLKKPPDDPSTKHPEDIYSFPSAGRSRLDLQGTRQRLNFDLNTVSCVSKSTLNAH